MKKINVLGTKYTIVFKDYDKDPLFEKQGIDGYCDGVDKLICVCNMGTYPQWGADEGLTKEYLKKEENQLLRHEIIHAFFYESGLEVCSLKLSGGWATNEEMVDWIALQFPKILKVFEEVGCL